MWAEKSICFKVTVEKPFIPVLIGRNSAKADSIVNNKAVLK